MVFVFGTTHPDLTIFHFKDEAGLFYRTIVHAFLDLQFEKTTYDTTYATDTDKIDYCTSYLENTPHFVLERPSWEKGSEIKVIDTDNIRDNASTRPRTRDSLGKRIIYVIIIIMISFSNVLVVIIFSGMLLFFLCYR